MIESLFSFREKRQESARCVHGRCVWNVCWSVFEQERERVAINWLL